MTKKTCVDCGQPLEGDSEERCPSCDEQRARKAKKWDKICAATGAALGVMVKSTVGMFKTPDKDGGKS